MSHWGWTYQLDYDLLKDFEPVAQIPGNPMLIVTRRAIPAATRMSEESAHPKISV
jgi:hypothetical protein